MTLEQIKTDIKAHHDSAESERVMATNDRDFYYFSGKASAYRTCIDILDKLEHSCISEEIKTEIKRMIAILTKGRDTNGVVALYWVLALLDKLEPTDMDGVIKTLSDSIGVPADYCGNEAKSYVIGYRKALFDIRENWNKRGNK